MANLALLPVEDLKTLLSEVVRSELQNHIPTRKEPFEDFPELLSRQQTAELLGVSLATLDNWAATGRLQKHRLGATVRFKKTELLNALNSLQRFQRGSIPNQSKH
jgi:excisionase family DNA binding protein